MSDRLMTRAMASASRTAPSTIAVSRSAAVRAALDSAVTVSPNSVTVVSVRLLYWSFPDFRSVPTRLPRGEVDGVDPSALIRF